MREDYNFFQAASGYGTDSVSVRVISVDGDTVEVHNVAVTSNNVVIANKNFLP